MKPTCHWKRLAATALLSLAATASQAHTGHGTSGLYEGLLHPFGLDHLLAMVAVGAWSVSALPADKVWRGPAVFMASLVISAVAGSIGMTLPFLEHLISLSVVQFGTMLVLSRVQSKPYIGLTLIAVAAAMHGLAHGAESPETGFVAYAIGFLMTTAVLHFGGVALGVAVKRYAPVSAWWGDRVLGLAFGSAGIYLFSQV